jgi:hypothetical protein
MQTAGRSNTFKIFSSYFTISVWSRFWKEINRSKTAIAHIVNSAIVDNYLQLHGPILACSIIINDFFVFQSPMFRSFPLILSQKYDRKLECIQRCRSGILGGYYKKKCYPGVQSCYYNRSKFKFWPKLQKLRRPFSFNRSWPILNAGL